MDKTYKIPCNDKIQQQYDDLWLTLGKSMKITAMIGRYILNWWVTQSKSTPGVSPILHSYQVTYVPM